MTIAGLSLGLCAAACSGSAAVSFEGAGEASAPTDSSGGNAASSGLGGGSSGESGTSDLPPQTGVCAGSGTRALSQTKAGAFLDDFEEATISPGWSSFNDVMPAHDVFHIAQVAGGAVGTAHAGHYAGTGALTTAMGGFGVGTVYNAAIDPVHGFYCVDVTGYDGVSFWAKAGPGAMSASPSISVNFILPATNMVSRDAEGAMNGGDCTANCYDHPRVTFAIGTSWAQYHADFASAAGGSATVQGVIQEIGWLSPDSTWDFYLDEIAYYKNTPPAGPVGN